MGERVPPSEGADRGSRQRKGLKLSTICLSGGKTRTSEKLKKKKKRISRTHTIECKIEDKLWISTSFWICLHISSWQVFIECVKTGWQLSSGCMTSRLWAVNSPGTP